jgi:hypothetical protein
LDQPLLADRLKDVFACKSALIALSEREAGCASLSKLVDVVPSTTMTLFERQLIAAAKVPGAGSRTT